MKKILFINPPNFPFTDKSISIEPVDVLSIASYIESLNYKVEFLDMDRNEQTVKDLKLIDYTHVVILFDYHIPLHTTQAQKEILEIIKICKKNKIKSIIGGKTSQYNPNEFLDSGVDAIIVGEMEFALKELLEQDTWNNLDNICGVIFKHNGKIIRTKSRINKINLDEIPKINRRLVDLNKYIDTRTILTSRGCFNKCTFCPVPSFWGNWRGKSVNLVVDEIEYLVKEYNQKKILFLDDNAIVNRFRMQAISEEIIKRKIKVYLGCLGTISSIDRKTLEIMYKAGFRWIHYGIESADQNILDDIKKGINIEQIRTIIKMTKKIGFRVRTSFIYDLPNITKESLDKTNELLLELEPDEIRIHFLTLKVGTKIYDDLSKKGERISQYSQYIHSNKPNIKNTLSKEIILKKIKELTCNLKKKNYLIIDDIKEFRDLDKLKEKNPNLKILTFCPLRYGLNWER